MITFLAQIVQEGKIVRTFLVQGMDMGHAERHFRKIIKEEAEHGEPMMNGGEIHMGVVEFERRIMEV